jgi:hypothetical protein
MNLFSIETLLKSFFSLTKSKKKRTLTKLLSQIYFVHNITFKNLIIELQQIKLIFVIII